MKVISRWRLGNLIGTIYQTTLGGRTEYEYRIRNGRKIVGRSFVYFHEQEVCFEKMNDEMNYLTAGDKTLFDLQEIAKKI